MCNLSEGIYENGLKQGFAEGKLEGGLLMLFELVRDKQLPIREAVKKVSEFGIKDKHYPIFFIGERVVLFSYLTNANLYK